MFKYEIIPTGVAGVLHLQFENRLMLTLAMCRIQEFYESPFPHIRNKNFSFDEFVMSYGKSDGIIDYFSYWEGFNVPQSAINSFFSKQTIHSIRPIEQEIKDLWYKANCYKYLIATDKSSPADVLQHELAHAKFELDLSYRQKVSEYFNNCPLYNTLRLDLIKNDRYADDYALIIDELQAYLLTSTDLELINMFSSVDLVTLKCLSLQLSEKIKR